MGFTTAHLVIPIQIGRSYCIYYLKLCSFLLLFLLLYSLKLLLKLVLLFAVVVSAVDDVTFVAFLVTEFAVVVDDVCCYCC